MLGMAKNSASICCCFARAFSCRMASGTLVLARWGKTRAVLAPAGERESGSGPAGESESGSGPAGVRESGSGPAGERESGGDECSIEGLKGDGCTPVKWRVTDGVIILFLEKGWEMFTQTMYIIMLTPMHAHACTYELSLLF